MRTQSDHAQQLIGYLAPDQVAAVIHLMEVMLDQLSRKLASAPPEDEDISPQEQLAVAQAHEWLRHNKPIPNSEILAGFGLTEADFERMAETPLPDEPHVQSR